MAAIVVCVKFVPDATAERRFEDDGTVDRAGVDGLLSELDEYAVEQALQVRETLGGDAEVTVLTVGPDDAIAAVTRALQMGADKGVHVNDDAIAGSDAVGTSLVLAEAVKRLPHDLVVCGMASTDGSMGVLPAMIAERLGMPALTLGSQVTVEANTVTVRRDSDIATETIVGQLPLVLSVTDQSGEVRYPSFKSIMAAKKKPVETWSLADLGLDPGRVGLAVAWTRVQDVTERPPRTTGEVVIDDDGSGAKELVGFLASKKFV